MLSKSPRNYSKRGKKGPRGTKLSMGMSPFGGSKDQKFTSFGDREMKRIERERKNAISDARGGRGTENFELLKPSSWGNVYKMFGCFE